MKRKLTILALLVVVALIYCGCSNDVYEPAPMDNQSEEFYGYDDWGVDQAPTAGETIDRDYATGDSDYQADSGGADSQLADAGVRKRIVTANLRMTADDPYAAMQALEDKATALAGYVADSCMEQDELGVNYVTLTLRIPAEALEAMTEAAGTLGHISSYDMASEEITQEYWDIQSRLKSAKAQEEQLIILMGQATNVEETLLVRESLAQVQTEIERYQGQIRLWDAQVAYSTLYVRIDRTQAAVVAGTPEGISIWRVGDVWARMKNGFANTGRFLVNALYSMLIMLSYLAIPLIIVAALVLLIVWLAKRGKKRRTQPKDTK